MFKSIITTILILFIIKFNFAQLTKNINISGSADVYFRTNLNADFGIVPLGTFFANKPGFALGMANIILEKQNNKTGVVADLVFGPRGEEAVFFSSGVGSIVNQLYVYHQFTDKVTATLGNFNTFLGYEVISPTGNFNYSTSYMFSNGPFSHNGLKFDININNEFDLVAGVFNTTDVTEFNVFDNYVFGGQLAYNFEKGTIYLNALFDDANNNEEKTFTQFDLVANVDWDEKNYFGLNATTASDLFNGIALYYNYKYNNDLDFGFRLERFTDKGVSLFENINENINAITLTANYKIADLTIIPEIRIDNYEGNYIPNNAAFNNNLSSFLVAAVYSF